MNDIARCQCVIPYPPTLAHTPPQDTDPNEDFPVRDHEGSCYG